MAILTIRRSKPVFASYTTPPEITFTGSTFTQVTPINFVKLVVAMFDGIEGVNVNSEFIKEFKRLFERVDTSEYIYLELYGVEVRMVKEKSIRSILLTDFHEGESMGYFKADFIQEFLPISTQAISLLQDVGDEHEIDLLMKNTKGAVESLTDKVLDLESTKVILSNYLRLEGDIKEVIIQGESYYYKTYSYETFKTN